MAPQIQNLSCFRKLSSTSSSRRNRSDRRLSNISLTVHLSVFLSSVTLLLAAVRLQSAQAFSFTDQGHRAFIKRPGSTTALLRQLRMSSKQSTPTSNSFDASSKSSSSSTEDDSVKNAYQYQSYSDIAGETTSSLSSSSSFSSKRVVEGANFLLNDLKRTDQSETSRRLFFASSLLAAGTTMAAASVASSSSSSSANQAYYAGNSKLPWEVTPVNKRTGITVFEAESTGYNVKFVTYLSRFLLCFDGDCQRWWYNRAQDIPRTASFEKVNEMRLSQFGAFSASVEVGLQEYKGANGPKRLLENLLKRYCPDVEQVKAAREAQNLPPLGEQGENKLVREIKEARRQIALLFGLMETNQPVEDITKLLAAIDNGSISSVRIKNHGSGYAPGYGPPEVKFPPPEAGENYETATGRAVLRPNGKILRVDVVNRGVGYTKAPTVTISPPAAIRFKEEGDDESYGQTAEAVAYLFRSGVNKGRIERMQLTNPGAGYSQNEIIRVRLSPPDTSAQNGGVQATATAVLELEVGDIQIVNNGTGYAVEKPIPLQVEPPPLTARVNMNDPMMARIISPDQPLPATTIPSKEMLKKMPNPNDPNSRSAQIILEAGKAGGCIGRGCYDTPVEAVAYARAEIDSYNEFRTEDDILTAQRIETALNQRSAASVGLTSKRQSSRVVSASSSGPESEKIDFLGSTAVKSPSSSQLLSLLPAGIGLEFNSEEGRYQLATDPDFAEDGKSLLSGQFVESSTRFINPDFGPRGRSPIERDMKLGIASYLRFVASGAICCSGVHLALTPIDVVKTKVQTNPKRYPGVIKSFNRVAKEEGLEGFFSGWAPTFLGFFVWGGLSYALTEFLRRTFTELAGADSGSLEVLIVLLASGIASFFGSFVLCPFEAVRIRSVAQPDFGDNIFKVFDRMVKEEGIGSLFNAVPAFLLKEIPFAMAKFTVFDVSTAMMYDAFPAAREDIQLSLLVSLAGGTLGGFTAAVVSNPADVTISEMKKAKSDMGPREAAEIVLSRGGPAALFTGLPLRLVFYALVVSLQFLVYDAVRIALGIGADDLKLYLDVLGGALSESGGPV